MSMEEGLSAEISEAVETIKAAGKLYGANWYAFLAIGLCFGFLNVISNAILNKIQNDSMGIVLVINLFVSGLLTMIVLNLSLQIIGKEKVSLNRAINDIRGKYFLYIAVTLLTVFIIVTGLFFLLLPGLYLGVVFYFADLYVMMGKKDVPQVFKSSFYFVKGVFRRVSLCVLLILCFILMPMFIAQSYQSKHLFTSKAFIFLISVFLVPFASLCKVVLYERIKNIKSKLTVEEQFTNQF